MSDQLHYNISHSWLGKKPKRGVPEWRAWESYYPTRSTPGEAIEHMIAGGSGMGGHFQANVRQEEFFVDQQLFLFDIEAPQIGDVRIADALAVPFVQQHAAGIWHTESSGKVTKKNPHGYTRLRLAVVTAEAVPGVGRTKVISEAIAEHIKPLPVDRNSFKPTQPAHGSTNHVEPPYINLSAAPICVRELASGLVLQAWEEMQRALTPPPELIPIEGDEAEITAANRYSDVLHELASAPDGERNSELFRLGAKAFGMAKGGYPGITEERVQADFERFTADWSNPKKTLNTIKRARNKATPKPLVKRAPKSKKSVPARLEPSLRAVQNTAQIASFPVDHTLNLPLLDRLPDGVESAVLQSGVGTFKTGLSIGEIGRCAGRSMYVTHTKELAAQQVERAAKAGVIMELYSEMLKSDLYRAPRLSTCINTLVLYVKSSGTLPPAPELLIVDEISQFIEQILIGGTLEGDELHIADQVMRHLIGQSGRVLVMDAHLSLAALAYIRSARPDISTVVNTYQPPRGDLYMCEKRGRALSVLFAAAMQGKRVACASFSVDQGQAIADELAALMGSPEAVLFIHAGNRGAARQAAFLRDPNGEALKYQAVVYSPVIGTGYSIDPPIDVLVALGNSQQSAEDVRQFIGRFRNVTATYVYLPDNQDVRESDAQAITERLIAAAERTAHPYVEDGRLQRSISPQARTYVQHHAAVRAGRNASQNHLRERFVSLCAGSYVLHSLDGDDQTTAAIINARRDEIDSRRRELSLSAPRIDRETFKRKQDAGLVSEADHAGHIAWTIAGLVGGYNETWRDRLWTEHKRKAAARYADLMDEITALQLADLEEAAFDDPLHKRKHRLERRIITEAFLRPLVDAAGEMIEYSAAELEATYRPIIEHHAAGLRLYFGWYAYRTNTAAGILRLVMRRIDLALSGARRRIKGEANPVQFYCMQADRYHAAVETARAIVAQRELVRMEAFEGRIAEPVRKLQNTGKTEPFAESVHPRHTDQPTGWAAEPELFNERMAVLTAPIGRST